MDTQQKTPQTNEWWEMRDGDKAYVVGAVPSEVRGPNASAGTRKFRLLVIVDYGREVLFYQPNGLYSFAATHPFDLTRHLPSCTGWDWEEPKDDLHQAK